ncbi:hypothetical protein N303_05239, partial [Cuculus canorus]
MSAERLGATWLILERRYSCRPLRYSEREMTRLEKLSMLMRSRGEMSMPGTQTSGVSGTDSAVTASPCPTGSTAAAPLTHGGARGLQDGLGLGGVHDDLLQPFQALLAQLLAVPDELGQAAVGVVLGDDLDELGEVVAV